MHRAAAHGPRLSSRRAILQATASAALGAAITAVLPGATQGAVRRTPATGLAASASAQDADALFRALDAQIEAAMAAYHIPGAAVGVFYDGQEYVRGYGVTSVQFGSAPENVASLTAAVMTEIDRLRKEGPSAEDVRAVKEAEKNDLQTAMRQNGYWLNSLQSMHLLGRDPKRILLRSERADSLTQENVHDALRKYFPADRHTEITLMPETRNPQRAQ